MGYSDVMQLGKIFTAQSDFANPHIIEVEVDITSKGIPGTTIVGLADKAIDESRERIAAALKNCGLIKIKQKKVIISLSPADIRKEGPLFDLPIALGILLADNENEISFDIETKVFIGELALDGSIKPIQGALSIAYAATQAGFTSLYLPKENAEEASLISQLSVFGVSHINELVEHLIQEHAEVKNIEKIISPTQYSTDISRPETTKDFAHIIGQSSVKRVLEIAAAGGHNVAMYGSPGTGKTMLAHAFCSILPPLSESKRIETTMIHSCAGILQKQVIDRPPLRAPHHTASYVSVIGGGAHPKPGEVTLSHNGVLFLDEFPEFDKRVLESLREPLEEGVVRISRAKASVVFPSNFILLAALNPPSAVYRTDSLVTASDERRFKKKLSGPIMDRIDMWIEVPKVSYEKFLSEQNHEESSATISKRVLKAREKQSQRLKADRLNADIQPNEISKLTHLHPQAKDVLNEASKKLNVSPRVYHKLIKIGRTVADLEGSEEILKSHILEALQYRPKEII